MHWEGYKGPDAPKAYYEYDQWMRGLDAEAASTPTPFPVEVGYPYRIVSDAIEFMDQAESQPFILQVGFPLLQFLLRLQSIGRCTVGNIRFNL